jgi:branched-chain amino acid transport system permease protein
MKTSEGSPRTLVTGIVLFVALFGVPLLMRSTYRLQELDYVLAVTMVAIGLNIVTGFAGQLALGPGGIFGIGGYAAAVVANKHPAVVGLVLMCLLAIVAASLAGVVIGLPALRVGGFYLGMTTLAIAALVPVVGTQWKLLGASYGLNLVGLPGFHPHLGGTTLYEVTVGATLVITLWCWALLHSRVGHRFRALAISEDLAASLGIPTFRTKFLAFLLSAWPAGIGGAFYLYTQQFFTATSANVNLSIYVLAACVIGGFGTVLGPLFGGLVVFGLSEFLSGLQQWEGLIFALLLGGFAILLPQGVMGFVESPATGRRQIPWVQALRRSLGRRPPGDHGEHLRPRRPANLSAAPAGATDRGRGVSAGDLVLSALSKTFGGVRAVSDVGLSVRRGTVHALIGSNGSGKTTILNLVSGFYRLDGGQILLGDERLDQRSAAEVAHLGVARTFQTPKLLDRESLLTNIQVAAELTSSCRAASSVLRLPKGRRADRSAREIAKASIAELGLQEYTNAPIDLLPHGLRRLSEIARCLATSPAVLLLDEPAAGLTHAELDRLSGVIRRAAAQGIGVLLIEHNVPFVFGLADEITVLHLGQVIATGTPEDIRANDAVAQAFLGSQVERIADRAVPDEGKGVSLG